MSFKIFTLGFIFKKNILLITGFLIDHVVTHGSHLGLLVEEMILLEITVIRKCRTVRKNDKALMFTRKNKLITLKINKIFNKYLFLCVI